MFFRIPQNHLIDLAQHFRRQSLAKIYHQRRIKWQLFIVIAGLSAEVLQIGILLNLQGCFLVRVTVLRLDDARAQGKAQRFCYIALGFVNRAAYRFSISSHGIVWAFLTQRLLSFKFIPTGCLKSERLICPLLYRYIAHHPSARLLPDFLQFPCTYCTTNRRLCLDIATLSIVQETSIIIRLCG